MGPGGMMVEVKNERARDSVESSTRSCFQFVRMTRYTRPARPHGQNTWKVTYTSARADAECFDYFICVCRYRYGRHLPVDVLS